MNTSDLIKKVISKVAAKWNENEAATGKSEIFFHKKDNMVEFELPKEVMDLILKNNMEIKSVKSGSINDTDPKKLVVNVYFK